MEDELISKKELLETTSISYGQLYRWKRKSLIPEDWFIKKSTFTGQETFFPKDKILFRINKIKNLKEDLPLDDIADMFSPFSIDIKLNRKEIIERNIVSNVSVDLYIENEGEIDLFSFEKILYIFILDKLLQSGEISRDEGKILLKVLTENYSKFESRNCDLVFIRKLGISTCFLISSPNEFYFEESTRVITRLNISRYIEELKIKL